VMMNMNSFLFSAKVVPFVDSRVNRVLKALFFYLSDIVSSQTGTLARVSTSGTSRRAIRASERGFGLTWRSRGPAFGAWWPPSPSQGCGVGRERQPAIRLAS
jgi:hypothetical protein